MQMDRNALATSRINPSFRYALEILNDVIVAIDDFHALQSSMGRKFTQIFDHNTEFKYVSSAPQSKLGSRPATRSGFNQTKPKAPFVSAIRIHQDAPAAVGMTDYWIGFQPHIIREEVRRASCVIRDNCYIIDPRRAG